jgi:DNA-binding transcriptional MerR regulator
MAREGRDIDADAPAIGVGGEQVLDGVAHELDVAGGDGGGVAPLGLADHHRRMVDPDPDARDETLGDGGQGDTGPAAELEHPLVGLEIEEVDRPAVACPVRRPVAHHPPGSVPTDAGWFAELRAQQRVSGQRRYAQSAVEAVGVVLFLRDVGFSLAEITELIADRPRTRRWSDLVERKLEALAEQEHRLVVARTALEHARDCPVKDPSRCPRFWRIIHARLDGATLEDSHAAVH